MLTIDDGQRLQYSKINGQNFKAKMLSKKNRLAKKNDFEKVFSRGKFFRNDSFTLRFINNKSGNVSRFGIIAGIKFSKKAVDRNKVKRRLRAAIKTIIKEVRPGIDAVLAVLPRASQKDFSQLKEELINLLGKAKVLK